MKTKETTKKELSLKELRQENANLKEAMEAIRFISFKHEVADWNDASGTDNEKLSSILRLSRESNWSINGNVRTQEIKTKHLL